MQRQIRFTRFSGQRYTDIMSTYLYKALIEANASDATATEAAHEIDNYKQDVVALKTKVDILLVGVGILIALGVIDKFL